ncbi:hypothetical protein Ssi03_61450 [Sphaerisporangium siamense]|nr:hypothetical protein Ssi03_61450 [Sphaerisporangium siamense]
MFWAVDAGGPPEKARAAGGALRPASAAVTPALDRTTGDGTEPGASRLRLAGADAAVTTVADTSAGIAVGAASRTARAFGAGIGRDPSPARR